MPYHQCITHTYHILRGEGEACIIFSLNDFTLLDRMTYFWIEWPIFGQNVLFLDRMSYFWMECPDRKASDLQFNWFSWLICADTSATLWLYMHNTIDYKAAVYVFESNREFLLNIHYVKHPNIITEHHFLLNFNVKTLDIYYLQG